ncbi:gamma-glutamyltransferase [Kordiimonas sediminis]|uniref:Glutathione hydrolase proenzyme n=1 Tax=Kordiimonas sediminis TaxID=1735581 RepID=A0A919E772_9PROT|nr:gamma-glutamyltransferase [Kordiimonas sediminis]GHF20777.1 gamma-glutamyltransferase [Kordiimonas sediminis]
MKYLRSFFAAVSIVLVACGAVTAQGLKSSSSKYVAPYTFNSQFQPVLGENGMVVAQETYGSEAGLEILKAGGNAVDAAVATGFALAVTHPQAGNLGGGGFLLAYLAEEDKVIAIDFREMAPSAAHRDLFLDAEGNVDNRLARFSMKSSGVPGTVMGLVDALEKYGTMSLKDVMKPAIRLAEKGFPMTWGLYDSLARRVEHLQKNPAAKKYFYKVDGSVYERDELFKQPDLAKTLKAIANKGVKGFYEGKVADQIVAAVQAEGGIMTLEDLKGYKAIEREAVKGTYRDFTVVSMPPPSSGGVHVIQMLNILEGYDLKDMGHNSAEYVHRLTESMKYAYADRSKYLGDPDYFDVPIAGLTDKEYAAAIRAKIKDDRATPSKEISPAPKLPYESNDTTHYSTADRWGNMVAVTYTLNFTFGNGKAVDGAGFLMNNEMDDFSAKPGTPNGFGLLGGEANAIEPGKRPLSSMTPTMVFKDGKPYMVTGSPGGSTIITVVLQTILNAMEFDMNAAAATAAPRIHHQWFPDRLMVEPGFSIDTLRILKDKGHMVKANSDDPWDRILGSTQTIMVRGDGLLMGAADPRRPGAKAAAF